MLAFVAGVLYTCWRAHRILEQPPATQINGARGKKGAEMRIQHHSCSGKSVCRCWFARTQRKASCKQKLWRKVIPTASAIDTAGKNKHALECAINNYRNSSGLSLPAHIA